MLREDYQISLEFPSETDFPLLVFYTCQSPSAETWKSITIPTSTTHPASFSAFYILSININHYADLILKDKCGTPKSFIQLFQAETGHLLSISRLDPAQRQQHCW